MMTITELTQVPQIASNKIEPRNAKKPHQNEGAPSEDSVLSDQSSLCENGYVDFHF